MAFRSLAEQLIEQFYEWERWGRGWATWQAPVHLEPPFVPFPGHNVPYQDAPDDGFRPTLRSRFGALFKGGARPTALVVRAPAPDPPEREPFYLSGCPELRTYVLYVPPKRAIRSEAVASLLGGIREIRYPVAFEIVGVEEAIAVQIAVRVPDEGLVLSALRSLFPDVTAVARDVLDEWYAESAYSFFGVVELGLVREFMLPIATPRSLSVATLKSPHLAS